MWCGFDTTCGCGGVNNPRGRFVMLKSKQLCESKIEDLLYRFFNWYCYKFRRAGVSVRTFEEAMVLTSDRGIVVRQGDSEYLVTIVRVR